jgi:predicted XRE-type DNA-binding protein
MAKKFKVLQDQVIARPGGREELARLRKETLAEYGLFQLRADAGVSQSELAERLGVSQPAVSKLEHAADMRLSTLQSYVEGLGGTMELRIEVAGKTTHLRLV